MRTIIFPNLVYSKMGLGQAMSKGFENVTRLITKETLLTYPNFNKTFEIHTDASKVQLVACISQVLECIPHILNPNIDSV
jgi:RNase H-like domain found in reverse transcriptase